jgi:Tat protein secretion system quality control protein TatD with DNase activity
MKYSNLQYNSKIQIHITNAYELPTSTIRHLLLWVHSMFSDMLHITQQDKEHTCLVFHMFNHRRNLKKAFSEHKYKCSLCTITNVLMNKT